MRFAGQQVRNKPARQCCPNSGKFLCAEDVRQKIVRVAQRRQPRMICPDDSLFEYALVPNGARDCVAMSSRGAKIIFSQAEFAKLGQFLLRPAWRELITPVMLIQITENSGCDLTPFKFSE